VPAAEKITTNMISTTPVLIELRVFQVLRTADRSEGTMTFVFLTTRQCTYRANPLIVVFSFTFRGLARGRYRLSGLH